MIFSRSFPAVPPMKLLLALWLAVPSHISRRMPRMTTMEVNPVASTVLIHTDCRHYKGSMPCIFHKKDGRLCEGCVEYSPTKARVLIVKLAAVGDVLRTTSI